MVARALASGCESIAYTYTEPTVFYEYCRDVGKIAKANGLKNVFVTNGYMQKEVVEDMATWLDAANVDDIKAFDDARSTKRHVGAHLSTGFGCLRSHGSGGYLAGSDHLAGTRPK